MTAHTGGPSRIDTTVPHSARIWNYWLGGKDNYEVDRVAGDAFRQASPGIDVDARAGRYFLVRTIRYLAGEAGVRQFLDVGTGLPTVDNTHQVAQRVAPESRIVYVDNDPLVLLHAQALLTSTPQGATRYIDADLADPESIIASAAGLLDLSRPVGLILSGILGHVTDYDEARSIVRRLLKGLPSGSYLSLHDAPDTDPERAAAQDEYNSTGAVPYILRTPEQIAGYFDGLEIVEPGIVRIPLWRPDLAEADAEVSASVGIGGVGRLP
ncbi:SAM-dependent methyltransferase [Streptomyces carpaticus]|uniref:SAM-dependent methyltransferase n=1 Tax=Streptomyces carpaticus TaxID=285558 RepID=A0ABV4ZHL6_9ACTN